MLSTANAAVSRSTPTLTHASSWAMSWAPVLKLADTTAEHDSAHAARSIQRPLYQRAPHSADCCGPLHLESRRARWTYQPFPTSTWRKIWSAYTDGGAPDHNQDHN
jgi:hypothetical protein